MIDLTTQPRTTRAAEGHARRAFTVADVERMVEVGLLDPDERLEVIGGEIVPMSPKGNHHEVLRVALLNHWSHVKPQDVMMASEPGLRPNAKTYLEPDFIFYRQGLRWSEIKLSDLMLVVEVADSSLAYDQGLKAKLYASFDVRELWVINAVKLTTRIHRDPAGDGYRDIKNVSPNDTLTPLELPALAVTLAKLELL